MSTLTPKKQEIRDREKRILELSRRMVLTGGHHGFGLESLAEELGVSRGTIYNHFRCKEDILLALLVETMDRRRDMFRRAAAYQAAPRVRMEAVGVAAELFARLSPDHFCVEQIVMPDSVWKKSSPERRSAVKSCQVQCVTMVAGIARDGIVQGHLSLPTETTPDSLVFGLWSMWEGAYSILATSKSMDELGISQPFAAMRTHTRRLLDGYQWFPQSAERDYDREASQIITDVFPHEFARLKQPW